MRKIHILYIATISILSLTYINNTIFEIKAPEGKTTTCVERNLRKAVDHQSSNIVIDSFRMKNIQDRSIQSFLIERLKRRHGVRRIIFKTVNAKLLTLMAFWGKIRLVKFTRAKHSLRRGLLFIFGKNML